MKEADSRRKQRWCVPALVVVWMLAALPAWGQATGAIDGVVRDESDAVLPGATVELSSPALIEGTRVTVSDGTGNYRFRRLPVGTYTVKFSLAGFSSVVRENVVINENFTGTINADLSVSAVEETLIVTAESAVVDLRSATNQTVVTSEVTTTIPSSRNIFDMGKFVLGISKNRLDIGGSESFSHTTLEIHGSRSSDRDYYVDGMPVNGWFGEGDRPLYFDVSGGAAAEVNYQTSALPASRPIGGVAISLVSKSGGNRVSGQFFGNSQAAQSANLDDKLRARGVRATSGAKSAYDVDGSLGGPIRRDRVWFFAAGRLKAFTGLQANQFLLDGSQATDYIRRGNYIGKVTWQLNQANQLAIAFMTETSFRPDRIEGATFVSREARSYTLYKPNYFVPVTWTGTRGDSWLYEIRASRWIYSAPIDYQPGVGPNDVPRLDIVTGVLTGATTSKRNHWSDGNAVFGSVTRVGEWLGNHELTMGVQTRWGAYSNEWIRNGDIVLRFRNGVPDSVLLQNTPTNNKDIVRLFAAYVQDAWRIAQRLTINAGLRYDEYHGLMPAQSSLAGTWVPAREFPAVDVQTFRNVVPRLAVVYDLTGNARTALKGSFSKYVGNEAKGLVDEVNPSGLATNQCAWTDTNGDRYAQASEISRCAGWGGGVTTTLDPNLRRPFNREYSLGIEHQLSANVSVGATYFRREYRDLRAIRNRAVPYESYLPVVITNPLTNEPLTIYNQNPATAGLQDNLLTNSSKLDNNYNGIEFAIQRRFSPDAYLRAGYHYGKALGRIDDDDLNDPNHDIFSDGAVGVSEPHQVKVSGAFVLPGGISVSGFLQAYTGHPRVRQLSVGRSLVPELTRSSERVRLERNDENRYDPVVMTDLRVGRRFSMGSRRFEAFLDAYNLTNTNTVLSEVTTIGSSLGRVSRTISPRVVRVGGKFAF